nr:uncharacterized protein LOC119179757 [Rhipicephalus microplus]
MNVRLRANEPLSKLAERLSHAGAPAAVTDLDLTNCIDVDAQQVLPFITQCKQLRRLMFVACPILPSDVLKLAVQLPHLEEIEFTILLPGRLEFLEMRRLSALVASEGCVALKLHRVYVETGRKQNLKVLSTLLRCFPNANYLHVHLVSGLFHEAVEECPILLVEHIQLDTFRLTSDLRSYILREPPAALDLAAYAAVSASFTYQKSINFRSCTTLRDLVTTSVICLSMPFQMTLFAIDDRLAPEWFREASFKHNWSNVRQLCVVLSPADSNLFYPAARGRYRASLAIFCTQLVQLVELNVSSFHFGPNVDVTIFLQDGRLPFLQSLSAPPCGFRDPTVLQCVAACCPDFKELDVRFERKDNVCRCFGCERRELFVELFRCSASPAFRNGLARLTLSEVHDAACQWFIECCRPVSTLRLAGCPLELDYERISRALCHSIDPSCLILKHRLLRFDDTDLLCNLFRFPDLQYLYLLLYTWAPESVLLDCVASVRRSLPLLKCLHVHYRCEQGSPVRDSVTWIRRQSGGVGEDLIRSGPCFQSCSTATFIGLAKPLNRDFQPML